MSARRLTLAALASTTLAFGGVGAWWLASPGPAAAEALSRAAVAEDLLILASLEQRHHAGSGAYALDLEALARLSSDPTGLKAKLGRHVDLETLLVKGDSDGYVLEANCLTARRTRVRLEGPARSNVPGGRS